MITNETVKAYLSQFTDDIYAHSPAAMERIMSDMEPWVVRVPTPSGKFHARNGCKLIQFESEIERTFYQNAWLRYVEECEKLMKNAAEGRFAQLVAQGKFRQAAEMARVKIAARLLAEADKQLDRAAVLAGCYRGFIASVLRTLVRDHGYSRDDVSLIWGGDDTLQADKQLTFEQMQYWIKQMIVGNYPSRKINRQIERQLIMSVEDKKLIEETKELNLRLGSQSRTQRNDEIYKFQHGLSRICLFTFSAGGVGLSLHHCDKDERGRIVNLRPRKTYLTPTWSAQDFVQGLGRAHRTIFSLSDTEQEILFYQGTIEEDIMVKVSIKLKSLSKVIKARESWSDAIYEGARAKTTEERRKIVVGNDLNEQIVEDTEAEADNALGGETSSDEEDEYEN